MANSQLRPYPYDGSTDVNEFLESFARYAEFADWNDRKKASALKTMLKDNASRWLSRQNFHDAIAYDDLVQHIRQKYQLTQSQIFQLHCELASTKQQPQDTVDTYAERIEQLCNRLDIEDPAKTHHFVNGLKDIYKAHVLRTEPADFEDARTAARAEEGAQALTNKCTAGNKSDKIKAESDDEANNLVVKLAAALNAVTAGSEKKPQSVTCQSCNQLGHTAPSCPNPRYQNACQLCGSMYHLAPQCPSLVTPQQSYQYQQQRQSRGNRRHKRCYSCGEIGHFQNTCPKVSQPQHVYRDPAAERPPLREGYDRPYNQGNASGPAPMNR